MTGSPSGDVTLSWQHLWVETTAKVGARNEARWLCERASGYDADEFLGALAHPATVRAVDRLDAMVARRLAGEPVQYVLGQWVFRTIEVMVDGRVLIPRPETELVAAAAIDLARVAMRPTTIVDLGTGSGAIALSMAAELPLAGIEIWATDASTDALEVARANLAGLGRPATNVRLAQGSWYGALPNDLRGRIDVVVSNPPYVATADTLDDSVRLWEPSSALLAGPDGLDDIEVIVADATSWLRPGGALVVEIGSAQGDAVRRLAARAGLTESEIRPDLAGLDRMLVARSRP